MPRQPEDGMERILDRIQGFSPAKYILEIRMAKARELLVNTGMQIQEIAWKLGFPNADYFTTPFKRVCAITPNEHQVLVEKRMGMLLCWPPVKE